MTHTGGDFLRSGFPFEMKGRDLPNLVLLGPRSLRLA